MLTSDDILKAIVECRKPSGITDPRDVMGKLNIDDTTLSKFQDELEAKGFIYATLEDAKVTSLGLSAYDDLTAKSKVQKSLFEFSKFSLKFLAEIIAAVIAGLVIAYLTYHFGWQQS